LQQRAIYLTSPDRDRAVAPTADATGTGVLAVGGTTTTTAAAAASTGATDSTG
jgi:hypothetical protein